MLDGFSGRWADVAGLEAAKRTLKEAVVLPNLRPDLTRPAAPWGSIVDR